MSNNFPVKVNVKAKVLSHLEDYGHYTFKEVFNAGVVSEKDGRVLEPFFLIKEDRTCNDEFGYLGWGDCLPPTYSVEFDFEAVKRQVQFAARYNRDPESRETVYLSVTRVIPRPLQKRDNGRVIHKEF
jgi:hypothetical protein